MKRRQLLKMAPAVSLAGLMSGAIPAAGFSPKLAKTETPVVTAYREWKAFRDHLHYNTSGMDDGDFDDLCAQRADMEDAMYALPSESIHDVALKIAAHTDCGNDFSEDFHGTGMRLVKELIAISAQQMQVSVS